MPYARSIALVFLMASLSACAGSRETATETAPPHPLVGSWDYELDSPQGLITGVLVVNDTDGVLTGSVTNTSSPILSSEIAELLFDPETFAVNFTFSTEEYGTIVVDFTLAGDAFDGILSVSDFGIDVPMTGRRSTGDTE